MTADLSLSHFSDDTQIKPRSVRQDAEPAGKPVGLWLSVDGEDDWPTFTRNENLRDTRQQNRFRVTLDPDARILHLTDYADLVHFTRQYGESLIEIPTLRALFVDWKTVASHHDGIIISPYIWAARHEFLWYYGWDCASGCIWNAHAITSITHHTGARSTTPGRNPA